jgi:uncharacterized protein (DUF433 family)
MSHNICSLSTLRGGQPCVKGLGISVGALVALIRSEGGVGRYLGTSHAEMLKLDSVQVDEVLAFCANQKCVGPETLEYCNNCNLWRDGAKSSSDRVARFDAKQFGGQDYEDMWLVAASLRCKDSR